jgi:hypothetical protein
MLYHFRHQALGFWFFYDLMAFSFVIFNLVIDKYRHSMADSSDYIMRQNELKMFYSISTLVLWLRIIAFFRASKTYVLYVHLITQIIVDVTMFTLFFLFIIIMFSHSNYLGN